MTDEKKNEDMRRWNGKNIREREDEDDEGTRSETKRRRRMNRKRKKERKRRRRGEGCWELLMLRLKLSHFLFVLSPLPVFVGFTCCLLFFLCGGSPQEESSVWTNWSYWDL